MGEPRVWRSSDSKLIIACFAEVSACKRASQRLLNFLLCTRSQKSRNSAMADSAQEKVRGAKSARSIVNEFGDPMSNLRNSRTINPPITDVLGADLLQPCAYCPVQPGRRQQTVCLLYTSPSPRD